eukprot:223588-Prorocentrum_minimum.AAC.2
MQGLTDGTRMHLLQVSLFGFGKLEDSAVRANGKGGARYKYGGGVLAPDGRIYCFPSDADRVLRIDPATDEAQCIGPSFASQVQPRPPL